MNRHHRRLDKALQRRQEEARMGRNRLAELLPRARTARMGGLLGSSPRTAADIRGAYTYFQGGGWHGDVTLAFGLKLGGGGNRLGTPTASPCGTEAEAEEVVVAILGALLAEADRSAGMEGEQRRSATIAATGMVARLSGDSATLDALPPAGDIVEQVLAGLSPEERAAVVAAARVKPREDGA